ncbi:MAG: TPM domain-containing protein [Chitinophagaceae bacterium]|nr:TPM domain-containing protein [Chitinophagaceae bacterium]
MGFLRKRKPIFSAEETERILNAIRHAEKETSGEVRVFVERKCKYIDAMDRARQIFGNLEMYKTESRNGVLFYIATCDHQLAVLGDEGIHKVAGEQFWRNTLEQMVKEIKGKSPADGLCIGIAEIGLALKKYFPYNSQTDKNELPDNIVFGN